MRDACRSFISACPPACRGSAIRDGVPGSRSGCAASRPRGVSSCRVWRMSCCSGESSASVCSAAPSVLRTSFMAAAISGVTSLLRLLASCSALDSVLSSEARRLAQVGADLLERHLVELARRYPAPAPADLVQAVGHGRQLDRATGSMSTFDRRRLGEEVERHVDLAGQQVAGAQLRAQALADQRTAGARSGVQRDCPRCRSCGTRGAGDRGRPATSTGIRNSRSSRSNSTPIDLTSPITMPRKSTGAPGERPRSDWLKYNSMLIATAVGLLHGQRFRRRPARKRCSPAPSGPPHRRAPGRRCRPAARWPATGCAACTPLALSSHVEAAGMPEARVDADELVVGRVDEHAQRDAAAVAIELVGRDLAHLDAPEVHRRADVERADVAGAQQVLPARGVARDDRRRLEALEFARPSLPRCRRRRRCRRPTARCRGPEMPEVSSRGRTTQKRVSAAVKPLASFLSCTSTAHMRAVAAPAGSSAPCRSARPCT